MKSKHCLISFLMATVAASSCAAPFAAKGWAWERPLTTPATAGFSALPISPEIFDQSQPSLADLRVLDSDGNLVPHVITWSDPPSNGGTERRNVQILNTTYQPRQFSRVVLDFAEPITKNEIQVTLPGQNFRRKATVEGSADTQSWEVVAENLWLFDVSLPDRSFQANVLNFPTNNFRYLRLTVYNMPDDPERVEIPEVTSAYTHIEPTTSTRTLTLPPKSETQDEKHKQTSWDFDLGHRNLPVNRLTPAYTDPYFHRGYTLLARNSTTETIQQRSESGMQKMERETPWSTIQSGMVFRIVEKNGTRDSGALSLGRSPYRYFRLVVYNQDDPPLHLKSANAEVSEARLVFTGSAGKSYKLIGGNASAAPPSFDIAAAVRNIEPAQLPSAQLGPTTALSHSAELAPWTERHGTLLLLGLLFAVGGMLALVFTSMRKMPPAQP